MGLVLLFLGVLFLLQNLGVVGWDVWGTLWRFWPVLLIVIGLGLIWGRRSPWLMFGLSVALLAGAVLVAIFTAGTTGPATTSFKQSLSRMDSARVEVRFGAGELSVGSLPESSVNLVEATGSPDLKGEFRLRDHTGVLTLEAPGRGWNWFGGGREIRLDAELSRRIPIELAVRTGASHGRIDLSDLKVTSLTMEVGASTLDLRLPSRAGVTEAALKAGASHLTVVVPQGVAARIAVASGVSSVTVAPRFPGSGGRYQSADYATAANRVDLSIEAGASTIDIR
ncbi:MAG: hypothetical protein HYY32_04040 [Chloroflexi bacterium]|nr:hypothetical protein [Chloroflexota bacterium]